MLESSVQSKLIKFLRDKGLLVVKINLCSKGGWPDLQVLDNGAIVFIECKAPGKKPRPLQVVCHEDLEKRGFKVIVYDGSEPLNNVYETIRKVESKNGSQGLE